MAKQDKFYPQSHFIQNPGKLPEQLEMLDGQAYHSIAKIRLSGNENRTLLALFRPKHLTALFEFFDDKIKRLKLVHKAQKKAADVKLKTTQAALRVSRRDLEEAESELEEAKRILNNTVQERDKALAKVASLQKKPSPSSAAAKEIKALQRELERIKQYGRDQKEKNEGLNVRLSEQATLIDRYYIENQNAGKLNTQLKARLRAVEDVLEAKGIPIPGVEESSGMISGSDMLQKNVVVRSSKPVPNGNPGTRR